MCKTEREKLQRYTVIFHVKKRSVILSELLWNLCFITWWILLCLYIFIDSERSSSIASKCFCESQYFIIIKHFAIKPTQRGELHTIRHCPQNLSSVHLQWSWSQMETSPVPTLSLALVPEIWKEGRKLVRKWTLFLQKLFACVCLGKNIFAKLCLSKLNWISSRSVSLHFNLCPVVVKMHSLTNWTLFSIYVRGSSMRVTSLFWLHLKCHYQTGLA